MARKVIVIGLDGVPYTLLEAFTAEGLMPNLRQLIDSGTFRKLESTTPPLSAPAWTSFMTGINPGGHSIFGFTDLKPGRRSLHLPSFDDIKAPVVWNKLGHRRCITVNLPFTYPARPLNGIMISGFVAPIFERAVYPASLIPYLQSKNYRIDVDAAKGRTNRKALLDDLFDTLVVQESVVTELLKESWDLFIAVVTGTDRLHHFFFDACSDPKHMFYSEFRQYYTRVDNYIGRVVQQISSETTVMLLSDHGFTDLKVQIYLNDILARLGYFRLNPVLNPKLEDIEPRSKAFALEGGRIYLNSKSRFADGILSEAAAQEFRAVLRRELLNLTAADLGIYVNGVDPNLSLFSDILTKEQAYSGDWVDTGPDLIILPRSGIDIKAPLSAKKVHDKDIFTGTHSKDNAFFVMNKPLTHKSIQDISQVSSIILDEFNEI